MLPGLTLIEDQLSFYNARRSGAGYNAATINAAIADLGSTECVMYLPKGMEDNVTLWTIDTNVFVPENISILVPCGVVLNIQAGIHVSFYGPVFNQCALWYTGLGTMALLNKTAINSQSYSDFFNAFVVSGGYHGLSPTCYSPEFSTGAYVANGQYVYYDPYSIHYGNAGANCASDTVWVVISSQRGSTIPGSNFVQVEDTNYYIDFTSTSMPLLPKDSAFLMEVHLSADQIVKVNDIRSYDAATGLLNRLPLVPWTPALAPGNYTYANSSGTYLRIGKLVYISGYLELSGVSGGTADPVRVIGFPYQDYMGSSGGLSINLIRGFRPGAGPATYTGMVILGEYQMYIIENIVGHYGLTGYLTTNRLLPNFNLHFTGTYLINL